MKKPLPYINSPALLCTLPLSKIKVQFRPFVVKEQKALLLAQQSEDEEVIYATIKAVISSCTNNTVDLETLPLTDLSYLFLQMKISSSGNDVKFKTGCENEMCEATIIIELDLSLVKVDTSKSDLTVKLTQDIGIIFKYPTIVESVIANIPNNTTNFIASIIDKIYDAESMYTRDDYTPEELVDWVENLNDVQLIRIQEFIENIPELKQELIYVCPKCNKEHRKLLEGLQDFFRDSDGE